MFDACLPLGPVVTSNDTFWPSLSVLKPGMLIAEKCANRSSPPPSGVMNPKPLASLNHFTVPVAISVIPHEQKRNRDQIPPNVSISRKERQWNDCKAVVQGVLTALKLKHRGAGYTTNPAGASGIFRARQDSLDRAEGPFRRKHRPIVPDGSGCAYSSAR